MDLVQEFQKDKDGNDTTDRVNYLVGWTVIPPNMMGGGLRNFPPRDAFDGAGCREDATGAACTHSGVSLAFEPNVSLAFEPRAVELVLHSNQMTEVSLAFEHRAVEFVLHSNNYSLAVGLACILHARGHSSIL